MRESRPTDRRERERERETDYLLHVMFGTIYNSRLHLLP
jgi:hypothetical protein